MKRIETWPVRRIADVVDAVRVIGPVTGRVSGVSTDSRKVEAGELFVALSGERFDGHDFLSDCEQRGVRLMISLVAYEPRDPATTILVVEDTLTALQKLGSALYREACTHGLTGVSLTGSNGKTTTKELIDALLSSHFRVHKTPGNLNNHIGVPLTLCALPVDCDVAVIEMGCNDFHEIEALTHLAPARVRIITSIGAAHLEKLGTLDGVRRAKSEIFAGATDADFAIVPESERALVGADFPGMSLTVGESHGDVKVVPSPATYGQLVEIRAGERRARIPLGLYGRHNAHNLGIAVAVALALQCDWEVLSSADLTGIALPGGRFRLVKAGGHLFVDDAYNANPDSVRATVQTFLEIQSTPEAVLPDGRVVVLGELKELGEHSLEIHRTLARWCAEQAGLTTFVGVGVYAEPMCEIARKTHPTLHTEAFDRPAQVAAFLRTVDPSMVLLKASRGQRLEEVLAEFENEKT